MRKVKAATDQRAWPNHEEVQSLLEEYTPFKTQMGMKAEQLKATHQSKTIPDMWVIEDWDSFLVITKRKTREMWVWRVSRPRSEDWKRGSEGKRIIEFQGRLDFIFLTLELSLSHPLL